MSETLSLLLLTQGTFKERACLNQHLIPSNCTRILANPFSLTLNELSCYCQNIGFSNYDLSVYMLALITLKATQEAPLADNMGLNYFDTINYFIVNYNQYSANIMQTYFSALIQEISASDDLTSWMKKIMTLSINENDIQPVRQCIKIRCSSKVNSILTKIYENSNKSTIFELIDFLDLGLQCKLDLNELTNYTTSIILEKIISDNDLRGFNKYLGISIKVDFNGSREIINKLKILQILDQENLDKIKFIEDKIGAIIPIKKYEKKLKQIFQAENLINSDINWNEITTEPQPFYARDAGKFRVVCYYIKFSNGLGAVKKSYIALANDADFTPVENEIKILIYLSNRSTPSNSFLKFYGSALNNYQADLYMESGGISLMNELTIYKSSGRLVEKELAERWIISLLNGFAELSNYKIYHCDIKPHNILVKPDKTLKIIDFSVSMKTDESETMLITMENPIQGTRGYMAPELQDNFDKGIRTATYKSGKADVFSLGLTILQIMTTNNSEGLNTLEKNKELHEKVNSVRGYPEWIKQLLHKMLYPTRNGRISFNKCLQYIQIDTGYASTINN
ncbi:hypothetical protein SteCoe_27876 [Stentor coeruleus]|uniref:Protein kinase domain-containing protein n=1 Tax=Stentor coeruleus TaxID=5963 RepID=A0A1R2BA11_9CILI|nr:hypothetical protein SteCoe_27876 [Stentor coeruleus]